jgi:hypothetical protein
MGVERAAVRMVFDAAHILRSEVTGATRRRGFTAQCLQRLRQGTPDAVVVSRGGVPVWLVEMRDPLLHILGTLVDRGIQKLGGLPEQTLGDLRLEYIVHD